MDAGIVRLAAAGILAAHGVGHTLGWLPAFGIASLQGVSSRSWALTTTLGDGGARLIGGALFLVPTVGFVAAGAALLLGLPWWRQVAVASAIVSLAAMALYPQAFTTGASAASAAVDVIVLYGVLVAGWGADPAAI